MKICMGDNSVILKQNLFRLKLLLILNASFLLTVSKHFFHKVIFITMYLQAYQRGVKMFVLILSTNKINLHFI